MRMLMFSIYDSKTGLYQVPFVAHNKAHAMRTVTDFLHSDKSPISRFPTDYELYEIAQFDDCTGIITSLSAPVHVCKLLDLLSLDAETPRLAKSLPG